MPVDTLLRDFVVMNGLESTDNGLSTFMFSSESVGEGHPGENQILFFNEIEFQWTSLLYHRCIIICSFPFARSIKQSRVLFIKAKKSKQLGSVICHCFPAINFCSNTSHRMMF
ncbi:hypothetical protein NPIL_146871 [Nephila pilipes]|uniref:Uncharacterized protein n=1 Tax=Nephila pilipes TaxID=299642 RepID=A0A8X6UVB0_NEPPI|nr:hypothetical protein NPIL_146871 [Nephila pilipes]